VFQPYDETLGWQKIAIGHLDVHVVPVPSFHGHMVTPKSAATLAKMLERELNEAQDQEQALSAPPKISASSNGRQRHSGNS
jgi:hypothetical protein